MGKSIFSRIHKKPEKPTEREQELLNRIEELNRMENLRLAELQDDLQEAKNQMQTHAARGCDLQEEMISLQSEIIELRKLRDGDGEGKGVDSPRQRRLDETKGKNQLIKEGVEEFSSVITEKEATINNLQRKISALEDAVKFGQMETEETPSYYSPSLNRNRDKVREETLRQTFDGQFRIEKELLEKALQKEKQQWEERNSKLAKEVQDLKLELSKKKEEESKLVELQKEVELKSEIIDELQTSNQKLEETVDFLETAYDEEVVGNGAKIFRLSAENEELKSKLLEMEEKLSLHTAKVAKMREEEKTRVEEENKREGNVERIRSASVAERPSSPNIRRSLQSSKSVELSKKTTSPSPSSSPSTSKHSSPSQKGSSSPSSPLRRMSNPTPASRLANQKENQREKSSGTTWVALSPRRSENK